MIADRRGRPLLREEGSRVNVGLLSPGDMGSAVGRRLLDHGAQVATCTAGRSERTVSLAEDAGIADIRDLHGRSSGVT